MKIVQTEVFAIRAPRKEQVRAGTGTHSVSASEFGIVRLETDDGYEGLGEISITYPRIGFSLCHAARRLLGPQVEGLDPLALPQVLAAIDNALKGELSAPYLRAAFEMALLDLAGRYYGVPVYQLLGGKCRDKVKVYGNLGGRTDAEIADSARSGLEQGYTAFRMTPFPANFELHNATSNISAGTRMVAAARAGAGGCTRSPLTWNQ